MPHHVSCKYSYTDYSHISCMLCGKDVLLFTPGTVIGKNKKGEEEEYCFAKASDGTDDILMIPCKHGVSLYCPICLAKAKKEGEGRRYYVRDSIKTEKTNAVQGGISIVLTPIFV